MSRDTGDNLDRNHSANMPMANVMDAYLSRRSVMRGSLGAAIAMIAGTGLTGCFDGGGSDHDDPVTEPPVTEPPVTEPEVPKLALASSPSRARAPTPVSLPPVTPPTCWRRGARR